MNRNELRLCASVCRSMIEPQWKDRLEKLNKIKLEMWSKEFEFVRIDVAIKGPKFSGALYCSL